MKLMTFNLNVFHVAAVLLNKKKFFFKNKVHLYEFVIRSIFIYHFILLILLHYAKCNIRYFAVIIRFIVDAKIFVRNFSSISLNFNDHDSFRVITSFFI